jgi:hypothetical protein
MFFMFIFSIIRFFPNVYGTPPDLFFHRCGIILFPRFSDSLSLSLSLSRLNWRRIKRQNIYVKRKDKTFLIRSHLQKKPSKKVVAISFEVGKLLTCKSRKQLDVEFYLSMQNLNKSLLENN